MNYILFDNDYNPAMRFEGLARAAFDNCNKYGGPFGIANQEVFGFTGPSHEDMKPEFKRALILVLAKLVIRYPENDVFKALEKQAWTASSQAEVDDIIRTASTTYVLLE